MYFVINISECFVFRNVTHYLRQIHLILAIVIRSKMKNVGQNDLVHFVNLNYHYVENYFFSWITYIIVV